MPRSRSRPRPSSAPGGDRPTTPAPDRRLPHSARVALLAVALLLAVTADDRWVGGVADGRQMIRTAVALAKTGQIGQARGTDFTIERPGGDAVSRFGMGFSLLQVPAAALAPRVEAARGSGASQSLFLVVPWLAVLLTAWAAARAALLLGAPTSAAAPAVVLASLASPLASYAAMEFSEPVQAAALGLAFAAAIGAAQRPGRTGLGRAAAAGTAAGFAVLTKSSLAVAAPLTLLPLLAGGDRRTIRARIASAAAGSAAPLAVWLYFELTRFGRLFGGYPDDHFTNPFLDGLWRLVIGPNRGLVLFFPAVLLAAAWAWRVQRTGDRLARLAAAGAWLPSLAMLAVAAPYWGWHGMEGWGPRLIVPSAALLAPLAAMVVARWPAHLAWGFVALGVVLNLPPLLQHPTPVATYVMNSRWPEVPTGREASDYPFYARSETADGTPTVVPFAILEREPSASPFLVYPWFLRTTLAPTEQRAQRLADPPWAAARPDIVPAPALLENPRGLELLAPPPRLGYLGRSLVSEANGPGDAVYDEALRDQVVRAQQLGHARTGLDLARDLARISPQRADALVLESLRMLGARAEAQRYLSGLPVQRRRDPRINVVLALFERDAGNVAGARALLASVASTLPGTPAATLVDLPPEAWPDDLHGMLSAPRRDAQVAGPNG